jgi:hydrogenase expression/formation protein HypE
MNTSFPVGKLPSELLAELFRRYVTPDPRVVVGPGIGLDAAVIDLGDRYLVAKTDPITFATDAIGWYAVHVNANDIATTGAAPRWLLATALLPEGKATLELADSIFAQLADACDGLGIALCGGHTEITYGLDRPLVVGLMLGEVDKDRLITAAGAQPGDALILTKGIAVEGTAIIARERADALQAQHPAEWIARCQDFLYRPGISVVRDAQVAIAAGRVHAMHDPTEGGLATALHELAQASHVGLWVDRAAIPVLPETATLCEEFDLNPLGLIASGALLLAVEADDAAAVLAALRSAEIGAAQIGQVEPAEAGVRLVVRGREVRLPRFDRDEITRLFE